MGAIELWPNLQEAISDPSSVLYIKYIDPKYDLTSQGTGVYKLTNYYMRITQAGENWMVSASGQYLYEIGTSDFNINQGILGAKTSQEMPGKSAFRLWKVPAVDSNSDNYFGFRPTITAKGKHYTPFYADFAYTPKNDVKTWYVNKIDKENGVAVIKSITGTVAKNQPVFVECPSTTTDGNKVDLTTNEGNKASGNIMQGVYFANADRSGLNHAGKSPAFVPYDASTMRLLAVDAEGNLTFTNVATSNNTVSLRVKINDQWQNNVRCIPHNHAYLKVDADCPAQLKVMNETEYAEYLKYLESLKKKEGDVNGDDKVNMGDVTKVLEIIKAGTKFDDADVNKDGRINMGDVTRVLEIIKKTN